MLLIFVIYLRFPHILSGFVFFEKKCCILWLDVVKYMEVREVRPFYGAHATVRAMEVKVLPNIKSAKKRVRVIKSKTLQNQMIKSALKTYIKKFEAVVESGNKADAETAFRMAVKKIDQACAKGILKKNTASRKKAQLACKLNKLAA